MQQPETFSPLATRLSHRPVVEARAVPGYDPIFNAGLLVHEGTYHLFARGVRDGYHLNPGEGPKFLDYVSDILVFESTDGINYSFGYVLATSGTDGDHSFEDPRVQRVRSSGDEQVVMTYTNLPPSWTGLPWRIGVHRLVFEDGRFQLDGESARVIGPEHIGNKDAVIFNLKDGRVALMHRIHPNMQMAVFESLDAMWHGDAIYWNDHLEHLDLHTILSPSPGALSVGAGAPPVPTPEGLLLFFHERRGDGSYTVTTRPQTYTVQVLPPSDSDLISEFWLRKRTWVDANDISLGNADRTLDLTLRHGMRVSGVIRDKRGVPLEDLVFED